MKRSIRLLSLALVLALALPLVAAASSYVSGDNRGQGPIFNRAIVLASRITMRDQPSLKGKTITRVPGGSEVTLISDANGWVQATYVDDKGNSYTGYLRDRYLAKNPVVLTLRQSGVAALAAPDHNAKHVGDLPRYTVLPVIGTWGNYYIVSLRNASAFIDMGVKAWTDTELAVYQTGYALNLVTLRKTPLYTGPGTDWHKVEDAAQGATLVALGAPENGWYPVKYDEKFVAFVNGADVQPPQ